MDEEAKTRVDRLIQFCVDNNLCLKDDGSEEVSPSKLAARMSEAGIEKRVSYYSDLLNKTKASFGRRAARDFEVALGMPSWHLDGGGDWPFSMEMRSAIDDLSANALTELENAMWRHMNQRPMRVVTMTDLAPNTHAAKKTTPQKRAKPKG